MRRTIIFLISVFSAIQMARGAIPANVFLVCVAQGSTIGEPPPCSTTVDKPVSLAVILQTAGEHPIFYGQVSKIRMRSQLRLVQPYPERASVKIQWFKVEPLMYHVDGKGHDPANPDFLWYANAGAPGGRTDRQPLPPDTIQYRSTELTSFSDPWIVPADAHPTDSKYDIHEGLGTMHYTVTVSAPGFHLAAPTRTAYNPDKGALKPVARVVYRSDDSYAGYLTGFFNVPGVFGPYDGEITHHLGVDCSHYVVGAWREYAGKTVPFTNVTGLRTEYVRKGYFQQIAGDHFLDSKGGVYAAYDRTTGQLSQPVEIAIRVGDVITCNYSTDPKRRQWDHVGVIYKDRGPTGSPTGILNGEDLIINAGPAEPSINRLADSEFVIPSQPTRIAVLRWRKSPAHE